MKILIAGTSKGEQLATIKAIKESKLIDVDVVIVNDKPINRGFEPEPFTISENKCYENFPVSKNGKGKKSKSWENKKINNYEKK